MQNHRNVDAEAVLKADCFIIFTLTKYLHRVLIVQASQLKCTDT